MAEGLTEVVDCKVEGARSGLCLREIKVDHNWAIGGDDDVLGSPVVWTVDLIVLSKLGEGPHKVVGAPQEFPNRH